MSKDKPIQWVEIDPNTPPDELVKLLIDGPSPRKRSAPKKPPRVPKKVSSYPSGRGKDSKSGIPAGGEGWGGPANGGGNTKPFEEANIAPLMRRANPEAYRELMADKDELRTQMTGVIVEVALTSENDIARANAADKVLDRLDGKPGQRIDHGGTLTLEALVMQSMSIMDKADLIEAEITAAAE